MNESRLAIHRRLSVTSDEPLLAYLLSSLDLKRSAVKNLLKFGAVRVNGTAIRQFDHPLVSGDEVTVGDLGAAAAIGRLEHAKIQPVYEDDSLIVVDKPAGLLTVASDRENTDTLFVRLNAYLQGRNPAQPERALVVHRIDRETSGLVVFAKSEAVKRQLQDNWAASEKVYWAIVRGCPKSMEGTIKNYLVEDPLSLKVSASNPPTAESHLATTHYRVLKTTEDMSLLEVRLETGRKHQIRVHLANLGNPVMGDRRYGTRRRHCERLALHAAKLRLVHPVTGELLRFSSPLPPILRKLVP
jgi:23S rRNA pseudouridine1911/1915/1917 synthase